MKNGTHRKEKERNKIKTLREGIYLNHTLFIFKDTLIKSNNYETSDKCRTLKRLS